MRRLASLVVVAALAGAALVVVGGGQVASGQTGPVGYTSGIEFTNGLADCEFWSVDLTSGAVTQLNDTPVACADGLTFAADGTLYAYTNLETEGVASAATLVTIDPATGAQTTIGELPPVAFGGGGMTFDAAGNLWLYGRAFEADADCAEFANCLWQIDPATAAATFVGAASENLTVAGLAGDCGQVLAVTESGIAGPPVFEPQIETVDTATAAFSPVLTIDEMRFATGLDFDDAGGLWALGGFAQVGIGPMQVAHIDLASGAIDYQQLFVDGDPQDPFSGFLDGLAVSPISCPVPPPPPTPAPEVVLAPTFTG